MPHDTVRSARSRWLARAVGLTLGLALLGVSGFSGAMAQDEGVTVGGGATVSGAPSASDVEAIINSIFAEVFGAAPDPDDVSDESTIILGGDIGVGGNMGGTITMGGGMGGDISIGGGSGGSGSSGGTVYGG